MNVNICTLANVQSGPSLLISIAGISKTLFYISVKTHYHTQSEGGLVIFPGLLFVDTTQWNLSVTDTLGLDIFGHFMLQYRGFLFHRLKMYW